MNTELEQLYINTINDLLNVIDNADSIEKFQAAKTKCKNGVSDIINLKKKLLYFPDTDQQCPTPKSS